MKVDFGAQDVCAMVKTSVEVLSKDATPTQRKAHKEDKKRDYNAPFLIHRNVDSKVFEKIVGETSSKAARDKLEIYFGGDAKVKKVKLYTLRKQLELLLKDDDKINDYISRLLTLTNQMKQFG